MRCALFSVSALTLLATSPALAGPDAFGPGPLIEDYGPIAAVDMSEALPADLALKISFDTATAAETGGLNRTLTSAARFLNMHVANGIPAENLDVAIVIHGSAVRDVSRAHIYGPAHEGADNANEGLIAALREHGVEVYVCGQSAAYYDVGREDLLDGVTMSLSAMTAHARLQQDGYTLNPF